MGGQGGERFEPDYVIFLQQKKTERKQMVFQIFVEPKSEHLLLKDAWKEDFLLQMKEKAIPVKTYVDDNDYKIWGLHFFNQNTRMKDFDEDFKKYF